MIVAVLVVVVGANETADYAAARHAADPVRKQELLAAAALMRTGTALLSDRIDPLDHYVNPPMSVSELRANHALGELPRGRPTPAILFDERSMLQTGVRRSKTPVPRARTYPWSDGWTPPRSAGGVALSSCTTRSVGRNVKLAIALGARGGQVRIALKPTTNAEVMYTRVEQDRRTSISDTWPLSLSAGHSRRRFYLASTMRHATLQVVLPAGRVRICPA